MTQKNIDSSSLAFVSAFFFTSVLFSYLRAADSPQMIHVSAGGVVAEQGMVSSPQLLCSRAGIEILQAGGNAIDAAVATGFALSVMEMGNAGLGGGGSALIWLGKERKVNFAEFYVRAGSQPRKGKGSASMVAVPGLVEGYVSIQKDYGRLPLAQVMQPAIRLAREGFAVSVSLQASLIKSAEMVKKRASKEMVALFYPEGQPLQAGEWLMQSDLARILEDIAARGREGFYGGENGDHLITDLNQNGNPMSVKDLTDTKVRWMRPLAGRFRQYTVLSAPPPLGGTQVIESLMLLDGQGLKDKGLPWESPESASLIADAIRIARADYSRWVHDPDSPVPANGLTNRQYLEDRRKELGREKIDEVQTPGDPWNYDAMIDSDLTRFDPWPPSSYPAKGEKVGSAIESVGESTNHFSVVDADRNAVAMTVTLGPTFGEGYGFGGVFYNNGLSRFGKFPNGNQWAAGRTPRSETAPTIVLEDDSVRMVAGAQGGPRIPPAVVFNLLHALEYGLSASESVAGPRFFPETGVPKLLVEGGFQGDSMTIIQRRGYQVSAFPQQSPDFAGAQTILVRPDGKLEGSADLRRAGGAAGY